MLENEYEEGGNTCVCLCVCRREKENGAQIRRTSVRDKQTERDTAGRVGRLKAKALLT